MKGLYLFFSSSRLLIIVDLKDRAPLANTFKVNFLFRFPRIPDN